MGIWLQGGGEWFFPPDRLPGAAFASLGCPRHDHLGPTFIIKHNWGCDMLGVKITHQWFLHCQSDQAKRQRTFIAVINVDGEIREGEKTTGFVSHMQAMGGMAMDPDGAKRGSKRWHMECISQANQLSTNMADHGSTVKSQNGNIVG